jgi:hypothetical protein
MITALAIVFTEDVLITKIAGNEKMTRAVFCMTPANYGAAGYQSFANEAAMR